MFIDPVRRRRLTPPGVICQFRIVHCTPDGVRLLAARLAINMALLTECGSLWLARL